MKTIPPVVYYTVLRLVLFVVPLVVMLLLGVTPWIAVVAAALIGLCLSYIFLRKPREAISRDLYELRHREHPVPGADDEAEDAEAGDAVAEQPPVPPASPLERQSGTERDGKPETGETGQLQGKN